MLNEQERLEIDQERSHYKDLRALCIDALKIVQRHRGWISDESVHEIASYLNMSDSEVDSVATFFNLIFRRKTGKHVIQICDSVSCWTTGSTDLIRHLQQHLGIRLGETTNDGAFSLIPIACLGACDKAPVMMIDETLYTELTPEKINSILERYRSGGND
jgi:NADH-quinone oxidoreductase subunit E